MHAVVVILCCFSLQQTYSITQYQYNATSEFIKRNGRTTGTQDRVGKDFILGGLFTVHFDEGGAPVGNCGSQVWEDGMDMMEAMLYAIDTVNSNNSLLPNFTLGYDIRDTCKRENIALDETIDLVFSSGQLDLESCSSVNSFNKTPVSVILGAFESFITIPVAGMLRLIKMPQISYGSSSTALSNRELYSYFYRTFPPDDQQARAIIDLIVHFGWDHISTINSNNFYGQRGIEEVHKNANDRSICVDLREIITDEFTIPDYINLADKLMNSTANVVVLFASGHHVRSLLSQLDKLQISQNKRRQFVWIASDTWAEWTDPEFNNVTVGKFGFAAFSENLNQFDDYYSQLTITSNKRNPWFKEFYKQYFKVNETGNKRITDRNDYKQFSVVPLVVDAVYSVAYAVENFIEKNCDKPLVWYSMNQTCQGYNRTLNGDVLFEYIGKVNFTSPTKNEVHFDELGNVAAKYTIFNYQLNSSCVTCPKEYTLRAVGYWDGNGNGLYFYPNISEQFGVDESGEIILEITSNCQKCGVGQIKREVVSSCCGTCDPCLGQNFTNSSTATECNVCPKYSWGNKPLTGSDGCIEIEESYLKPYDGWAIALMILAFIGLISVVFVTIAFVRFWNTPIVKSSGREQMILLLIGISLCFVVTVLFIVKPSTPSCTLQRIGSWFCFSLVLSALLVKLIRIARIFLRPQTSGRPRFISSPFQILFTFLFVGGQMTLVFISLLVVHPNVAKNVATNKEDNNDFPKLVIQCSVPHTALIVLQIVYCTVLIIASNALAILTIRFPQNFNESKYVAFSTFSFGVIWIAFVLTYFATDGTLQAALISFAIQLCAFAVLVCLFGPRVFIMIFWPSQNVATISKSHVTQTVPTIFIKTNNGKSDDNITRTSPSSNE